MLRKNSEAKEQVPSTRQLQTEELTWMPHAIVEGSSTGFCRAEYPPSDWLPVGSYISHSGERLTPSKTTDLQKPHLGESFIEPKRDGRRNWKDILRVNGIFWKKEEKKRLSAKRKVKQPHANELLPVEFRIGNGKHKQKYSKHEWESTDRLAHYSHPQLIW